MKTLEQILEICCNHFGCTPEDVRGGSQEPHIAAARQAYAYHADLHTGYHTSKANVMHFIKKYRASFYCISGAYRIKLETLLWLRPINDQIEYQIITN